MGLGRFEKPQMAKAVAPVAFSGQHPDVVIAQRDGFPGYRDGVHRQPMGMKGRGLLDLADDGARPPENDGVAIAVVQADLDAWAVPCLFEVDVDAAAGQYLVSRRVPLRAGTSALDRPGNAGDDRLQPWGNQFLSGYGLARRKRGT